jgi:hypothetical protein
MEEISLGVLSRHASVVPHVGDENVTRVRWGVDVSRKDRRDKKCRGHLRAE